MAISIVLYCNDYMSYSLSMSTRLSAQLKQKQLVVWVMDRFGPSVCVCSATMNPSVTLQSANVYRDRILAVILAGYGVKKTTTKKPSSMEQFANETKQKRECMNSENWCKAVCIQVMHSTYSGQLRSVSCTGAPCLCEICSSDLTLQTSANN